MATLRPFIGRRQMRVIIDLMAGEEGEWFHGKMIELAAQIEAMPQTYQQDGLGDQAIAHLHYFTAGTDVWITEKDMGSADDSPEEAQWQAFGMVDMGYGPETGYVCLPEILAAGAEIDLHWTPKTLAEIKAKLAA
jgi:hypothetical protein